jgi:hypothetical protein
MERIVSRALKEAKKHANIKRRSVVSLSFFERPSGLFPMTTDEMENFIDLLRKVSGKDSPVSATALRNVSQARRELAFDEEFALFFDYYLSRIPTSKPLLKEIHAYIQGQIRQKRRSVSPWYAWSDFVTWRGQTLGKGVSNSEGS